MGNLIIQKNFELCNGLLSPMPSQVPEVLAGLARRGSTVIPTLLAGAGSPCKQRLPKLRNQGLTRYPGRLFFGFILLEKQKNETRLRVREPDSIAVALATQQ